MDSTSKEQLRQAYGLIKSGRKVEASGLLAQIIRKDRDIEQAWYLLAQVVSDIGKKAQALQQVLRINPENTTARSLLDQLTPETSHVRKTSQVAEPQESKFVSRPFYYSDAQEEDLLTRLDKITATDQPAEDSQFEHPPFDPEEPVTTQEVPEEEFEPVPAFSTSASDDPSILNAIQSYKQSQDIIKELIREEPNLSKKQQNPPKRSPKENQSIIEFLILALMSIIVLILVWFSFRNPEQLTSSLSKIFTYLGLPDFFQSGLSPYPEPGSPDDSEYAIPSFVIQACPFSVPKDMQIECGFISIPENRQTGNINDPVQLFIAIVHGNNPSQITEPLLVAFGNPGEPVVKSFINTYPGLISNISGQRDVVVFDPRGVGYSRPRLNCPELWLPFVHQRTGGIPADALELEFRAAIEKCHTHLGRNGVDIAAYNTTEGAADIRDIVLALGYKKVDLYGSAYGSRQALAAASLYPQFFHALILEAPLPTNDGQFPSETEQAEKLLNNLFEDCAEVSDCNYTFPNLKSIFNDLLLRYQESPLNLQYKALDGSVINITMDSIGLANSILWGMRFTEIIPTLPKTLYDLNDGNLEYLNYINEIANTTTNEYNLGASFSILCNDQVLTTSPEGKAGQITNIPGLYKFDLAESIGGIEKLVSLCRDWGAEPTPSVTPAVGWNNLPVLILEGSYDPLSSSLYAEQLAGNFPQSYLFEFPYYGNTIVSETDPCPYDLLFQFIKNPSSRPDSQCLDNQSSKLPFIIPSQYNELITFNPVADPQNHLVGVQPVSWTPDGNGYYQRMAYPLDITQAGMLSTLVSREKWIASLSAHFIDKGFDASPTPIGTREANGLGWVLYSTSSANHPVYLAFTEANNRTYLVFITGEPGEENFLKEAVYQPMIDALQPQP